MLQVLDLSANQLMRPGVLAVARALAARGGSFELLSLDENAITEGGIDQLKGVLKVTLGCWYSHLGCAGGWVHM